MLLPVLALLLADAASMMAAGDRAIAARDFRTALFAYQDATREDPGSAIVMVKLADTYARMGHDPEAIEYYARALKLEPRNSAASQGIRNCRERMALLAPSVAPRMVEPPPRPVEAKPLETRPVDEAGARERYTAAVKLINERKYADAVPVLDDTLQRKPGYGVALVARGSAHMGLLQYEAAAADYDAARTSDPTLASPLFGLAEAYRAMGQPAKAAELYKEYAASPASDVQPRLRDYAARNAQALASQ
jgi:tetratricopeptide (TPR) repeat protein